MATNLTESLRILEMNQIEHCKRLQIGSLHSFPTANSFVTSLLQILVFLVKKIIKFVTSLAKNLRKPLFELVELLSYRKESNNCKTETLKI